MKVERKAQQAIIAQVDNPKFKIKITGSGRLLSIFHPHYLSLPYYFLIFFLFLIFFQQKSISIYLSNSSHFITCSGLLCSAQLTTDFIFFNSFLNQNVCLNLINFHVSIFFIYIYHLQLITSCPVCSLNSSAYLIPFLFNSNHTLIIILLITVRFHL